MNEKNERVETGKSGEETPSHLPKAGGFLANEKKELPAVEDERELRKQAKAADKAQRVKETQGVW